MNYGSTYENDATLRDELAPFESSKRGYRLTHLEDLIFLDTSEHHARQPSMLRGLNNAA